MIVVFLLLVAGSLAQFNPQPMLDLFEQQVGKVLHRLQDQYTAYPDYTQLIDNSTWEFETDEGWTSGFFPGLLWQMANQTGNVTYAQLAELWTAGRSVEAHDNTTHDVGFMVFDSFGKGLQMFPEIIANSSYYTQIILETAQSLSERYSYIVNMTRSWGAIDDLSEFEVIIDNLMNLEILFWAGKHGGNPEFTNMAISHVDKTFEWWVRPDSSTFHLVVFNPNTSAVISRSATPQGLSVNSTWARGHSWGIYGFTMAYRYTGLQRFLDYAQNLTIYWFNNIPSDHVPKWDFDAVAPNDERDTSSAAIAASAYLELAKFTNNKTYYDEAVNILTSLSSPTYLSDASQSEAVLSHCFHDCNSNNCTLIESDYYFYEAIRRYLGHFP